MDEEALMAELKEKIQAEADEDASAFVDATPFWVIWQTSLPAGGRKRIRRISQDYVSAARAEADAERYRRSGAVTWVEEARPLAPKNVPAEALEALRGPGGAAKPGEAVTAIGARAPQV
jgi:hypothetical protein